MQSVLHFLLFHLRTKKSHQACLRSTHGKPANVGVDAAARIQASIAGRIKLRYTLPPLASNDLFGGPLIIARVVPRLAWRWRVPSRNVGLRPKTPKRRSGKYTLRFPRENQYA